MPATLPGVKNTEIFRPHFSSSRFLEGRGSSTDTQDFCSRNYDTSVFGVYQLGNDKSRTRKQSGSETES